MPTQLPTYKASGQSTSPTTVSEAVFGLEVKNHQLLKTAHDIYLSNRRQASASTKTRGLVRGGGKKPWRQKGTGRARVGSIRSPIWRGGGIVFGPTGEQNYQRRLPKKAKRLAVRQALSLKKDQLLVVDSWPQTPKTAELARFLAGLPAQRRRLVIADAFDSDQHRAAANLADLQLITATHLNVVDILNADSIIIVATALEPLTGWLVGESETAIPAAAVKANPKTNSGPADKSGL